MEHIPYETLKSSMCELFTKHGHVCPYIAKYYDENTDKMTCGKHKPVCRKLYDDYKAMCGNIKKCSLNPEYEMSSREIKDVKLVIGECIKQRIDFTHTCCNNRIDAGHAYFLYKLNSEMEKCNTKLKEKRSHRNL